MTQGLFIALLAALAVAGILFNGARQEAEEWEQKAAEQTAQVEKLKAAIAEREMRIQAVNRSLAAEKRKMKEVLADEKDWSDARVPDAVGSLLKGDAARQDP